MIIIILSIKVVTVIIIIIVNKICVIYNMKSLFIFYNGDVFVKIKIRRKVFEEVNNPRYKYIIICDIENFINICYITIPSNPLFPILC